MFKRIGLGGEFQLDIKQAQESLGRATQQLTQLQRKVDQQSPSLTKWGQMFGRVTSRMRTQLQDLGQKFGNIGRGLRTMTLAALPVSYALKKGVDTAVGFEQQMANVKSLMGNISDNEFRQITNKAKEMGIVSAFSAKQAGEAMEYMRRAGANTVDIVGGISGVMNAAAADSIDLGSAANVVAITTKAMGLEWNQANKIADVLAKTSSMTNTNILLLGESMTYGAATARDLGISLEETSAIFGALGDAGLKGSLAGTSFTNMMNKLAKPTSKANKILEDWEITLTNSEGGMKRMDQIVAELGGKIHGIRDPMKRAATMAELFGIRGKRAFSALMSKGPAELGNLIEQMNKAAGSATKMAEERLNTLKGRFTLFGSSVQGAMIELFGPMMKPLANTVNTITSGLNNVLLAVQMLKDAGNDNEKQFQAQFEIMGKFGESIYGIAQGVMDAITWMKESWQSITSFMGRVFGSFADKTSSGMRGVVSSILKITIGVGVIAPLAAAVGLLAYVLKSGLWPALKGTWGLFKMAIKAAWGFIPALKSLGKTALATSWKFVRNLIPSMVSFIRNSRTGARTLLTKFIPAIVSLGKKMLLVGGPILVIIGLIVNAIMDMKNENIGLWDSIMKVWQSIKEVVGAFLSGFIEGAKGVWKTVKRVFMAIGKIVDALFGWLWKDSRDTGSHMKEVFGDVGKFLGKIVVTGLELFAKLFEALGQWIVDARGGLQSAFSSIDEGWQNLKFGIGAISLDELKKEERRIATIRDMMNRESKERAKAVIREKERLNRLAREQEIAAKRKVGAERAAKKPQEMNVNVDIEDKSTITNKNTFCVDGKQVATVVNDHHQDIHRRRGFKSKTWHTTSSKQLGAPVAVGRGG